MALIPSFYVDPGSYQQEVIQPGSVAISSERIEAIVAIAPRTKRATNEAVIRGKVYEEDLTSWSLTTPYICTLASVSNRDRNDATLRMNGNALSAAAWTFRPAQLQGVSTATVDTTLKHYFTLLMDGKAPATLELTTKGAGTPIATIASELNAKLALVAAYGTAYNAVFSIVATNKLTITSPISTSASDIKLFLSFETAGVHEDCASAISGAAWAPNATTGVQAVSVVQVMDDTYSATATYDIDYVSITTQADPLQYATTGTPLSSIVNVGSYPAAVSYTQDTDYEDNSNTIDWYIAAMTAQATLTGITGTYAIVLNTNDHLYLSLNGLTTIDVTLTAGPARTATQIAAEVGAALSASSVYGPAYSYTMTATGAPAVKLTAPAQFENYPTPHGAASSITLVGSASHPYNAATTLFNVVTSQLPYSVYGVGSRPSFASIYYVTYNYTRATTEYNTPVRVYNPDQLYSYTSPLTLSNYTVNKMAIAAEIAFENNAPSLYLQLINDSTVPGSPTQSQINTAIDNCGKSASITEVVPISTSEATHSYGMGHVTDMSTMTAKKPRRGWYGCARSTSIGDPDTPDTFVYRANITLQPPGTSTGRGRQILVAPSDVTRTVTLEDKTEIDVEVDGSYLAAAVAALSTSLPNPSSTMVRKTIRGFKTTDDTFQTYLDGERATLADNGVCVVTLDGGNLKLLDPLTTEAGGVPQFEEPMSSCQKDSVSKTVNSLLDANVVGVVPDDLADFITDVKLWIMLGVQAEIEAGNIAPFRNSNGTARDIDPKTDIQVWQSTTDPRKYVFYYWFNLKYPAKRFFGQYSVDNPFFGTTA